MFAWLLANGCSPTAPRSGFQLELPLACEPGRTCIVQNYFDQDPGPGVRDHACLSRTYDGHDGTDFRVPNLTAMRAGVAVLASATGTVRAVRDGEPERLLADGEKAPAGRECGNGVVLTHPDGWETQYCHLARGSVAVAVGDVVAAGGELGRVGLSGQTQFPHVHLNVRRNGAKVDPFAPGPAPSGCGEGAPLWSAAALASLSTGSPLILDAGFSTGAVSSSDAERGDLEVPDAGSAAIVAWVRAIGLEAGDVQSLRLVSPTGEVTGDPQPPLERAKATYVLSAGKRNKTGRLTTGTWRMTYSVTRAGVVVAAREAYLDL
jgi:hypothetical protein